MDALERYVSSLYNSYKMLFRGRLLGKKDVNGNVVVVYPDLVLTSRTTKFYRFNLCRIRVLQKLVYVTIFKVGQESVRYGIEVKWKYLGIKV